MLRSIAVGLGLLPIVGTPARPCDVPACVCVLPDRVGLSPTEFIERQRERTERLVLGTVTRIDTLPSSTTRFNDGTMRVRRVVARMRVERVWRGPVVDTMTVLNTHVELKSSCEMELSLGRSYVVFAQRLGESSLTATECSGTVERTHAASTLEVLGPGQTPQLSR